GAGDLDARIEVQTGDELETLANQFNSMTAQLKQSYAGLERKVEERTRELTESLEQQTATAEVLKVISRSAFDLQAVLPALVDSAVRLCDARQGVIRLRDGNLYRMRAVAGESADLLEFLRRNPIGPNRKTAAGRAVLAGAAQNIADLTM